MHQQHLKITLLTKLVASARSGSSGGHRCLEYLPGSLLFGLCARLWKKDPKTPLPAELFFSGDLRFTDGLPEGESGSPAVPAVFSLHLPKTTDKFCNHATSGPSENKEKQVRSGHLAIDSSESGALIHLRPSFRTSMKTAINPGTGNTPAEGQLFGYQAIPAGTVFYASIQAAEPAILQQATDLLTGVQHLGRSRSAEYGEVSVESIAPPEPSPFTTHQPTQKESFRILLLSDLCLSKNGSPSLLPDAEQLGLPRDIRFDAEGSHIRTRAYSPWVQWRNGHDLERQVLSRGSVLRFEGRLTDEQSEALTRRLDQGIGLFAQEGLGRGVLNPAPLDESTFRKTRPTLNHASSKAPDPGTLLTLALRDRYERTSLSLELGPEARNFADQIHQILKKLHRELDAHPGKTQWGNVRGFAVVHRDKPDQLKETLRRELPKGIRKEQWTEEIPIRDHGRMCLLDFLCSVILERPHGPQLLALTAGQTSRLLAQNPIQ